MGKGIFDIDFYKLADGKHSFFFEFDSTFFDLFEDSIVNNGSGTINVELDRSPTMITMAFKIEGEVELVCDRSLDNFMYPIAIEEEIRLKFGDHGEELSEDLYLISTSTQKIDVGQFVYEFVSLAIPMKKLHPRYNDDNVDQPIVYTSGDQAEESSSSDMVDPRWNELKRLKKK